MFVKLAAVVTKDKQLDRTGQSNQRQPALFPEDINGEAPLQIEDIDGRVAVVLKPFGPKLITAGRAYLCGWNRVRYLRGYWYALSL